MSFDRVAPFYRSLEWVIFGDQLQQARLAFLSDIGTPRRVLIVGEGDGRFLAEFVRLHPRTEVECVEASARMIALARSRLGDGHGVKFIQADLTELTLETGRYDLIVTHFFLDCFAGAALRAVVEKILRVAAADAAWLLADFRIPDSGSRRLQARLWIRTMYLFFRLTSGLETHRLDDPSVFLQAAGFACERRRLVRFGMIISEFWRRSA